MNFISKVWLSGLLLFVSALGVRADEAAGTPVRIAGSVFYADVPTAILHETNVLASYGLDATFSALPFGGGALAELLAGEADFALTSLEALAVQRVNDATPGQGDDPVILASLMQSSNLLFLATLEASGLNSPEALLGKRVGVMRGSSSEYLWWLFAQYHGLSRDSVTLVDLSGEAMVGALASGDVDAAVIWNPWATELESRLAVEGRPGLYVFEVDPFFSGGWVLATKRATARDRPMLAQQVIEAYHTAIEYLEREPEQAMRIFQKHRGLREAIAEVGVKASDYDLTMDWSLVLGLQQRFAWLSATGRAAALPVEVLDLVEMAPLHARFPLKVALPMLPSGPTAP
jgi:ABC-type nitrate/sulfonate/bicarbonate transport system substrate-binding protein